MRRPFAAAVTLSIATCAHAANPAGDAPPDGSIWHNAGLLVGTSLDEGSGREYEQWLPFDWSWNLVVEQDSFEHSVAESQARVDELWAVIDTSDASTKPLPDPMYQRARLMLAQFDPDADREFELRVWIRNGEQIVGVPVVEVSGPEMIWGFPHYDSEIRMRIGDPVLTSKGVGGHFDIVNLEGEWIRDRGDRADRVPFRAQADRKPVTWFLLGDTNTRVGWESRSTFDVRSDTKDDTKWAVQFSKSGPAVAQLTSLGLTEGHAPTIGAYRVPVLGTFLTPTGDYGFLAGARDGYAPFCGTPMPDIPPAKLVLSCFDGAHAFLFTAVTQEDGSLKGDFWSGNWWHETWTAQRDPDARLPDMFGQTTVADAGALDGLAFKALDGAPTRVTDLLDASDAPARVLYVFGTWCPNCSDAAAELKRLKDLHGDRLGVVGLAFELTDDHERSARQVQRYQERFGATWPILIAGLSDKSKSSAELPILDRVRSYPTTIFLNRENEIVSVHTGFTGPATGEAFSEQQHAYERIIGELISRQP